MTGKWLVVSALALASLALGGCAGDEGRGIRVEHSAPGLPAARRERVNYNGRYYDVSMQRRGGGHLVRVSAPGRRLGATAGDRRIVEQIAASTVNYFACREGGRAKVLPGSQRHVAGRWEMVVRCM